MAVRIVLICTQKNKSGLAFFKSFSTRRRRKLVSFRSKIASWHCMKEDTKEKLGEHFAIVQSASAG